MKEDLLYFQKANGKLLLSGEYFVLDGAQALACPTKYGQTLEIIKLDSFSWESISHDQQVWLQLQNSEGKTGAEKKLIEILNAIPDFEFQNHFKMTMDFPRDWGLGSSSTLIALLADYFRVNPYELNDKIFQGSGYDIACAFSETPILYSNETKYTPQIKAVQISETLKKHCYFAYLNKKQDSREGIHLYRRVMHNKSKFIQEISIITKELIEKQNLQDWLYLMGKHEEIISSALSLHRGADSVLKGLPYFSKSLGAWGGDFVLILTEDSFENVKMELSQLGIEFIFRYEDLLI